MFLVLATAAILTLTVQILDIARSRAEWIAMAIGSALGGMLGGWWLRGWTAWGPQLDGLYLLAGFIGAVLVGGAFQAIARLAASARPLFGAEQPEPWSPD
jgi:uncharacterized membrane protein YeaQ/YmgE (transglycosylase-associated protein family)